MLKKRIAAVLLLVCVLCACSAGAEKYGYAVDTEAMKALEEACLFPVWVREKKVLLGSYDAGFVTNRDADMLLITVKNDADTTVTSLKLGFIAVDADGLATDVTGDSMTVTPIPFPETCRK